MILRLLLFCLLGSLSVPIVAGQPSQFVSVNGHKLYRGRSPYYFVGANYWYGSLLGLDKDRKRGLDRLRSELDTLKANGVTNLRLMAGAEGSGLLNAVTRVGPPLQPQFGTFDESVLDGLDRVLFEMGKRNMTAVVFLSNNWEWSGGFQQYLIWNNVVSRDWLVKKPTWDELRDIGAKFYTCQPCKDGYNEQLKFVVGHRNKLSGKKYTDDTAIMAWELANEPRPMRPAANDDYRKWITDSATLIRSVDKNHLVTTGHEGWIGTEDIGLFERVHRDTNIDYLTIHIWPKNWGWFADKRMAENFSTVLSKTESYIRENLAVAVRLDKPMVIEEFGLPRDGQLFDPSTPTTYRDAYYATIFSFVGNQINGKSHIAGANFWAFGGTARPTKDQLMWKAGDELMGDPPMEEQGLNSVFDTDTSTLKVIKSTKMAISRKK